MTRLIFLVILLVFSAVCSYAQQAPTVPLSPGTSSQVKETPSKSLINFFGAVTARDYQTARKFLPDDVIKAVENSGPSAFEVFINEIGERNDGNTFTILNEKIVKDRAVVETVTISKRGKRSKEQWGLRLEDGVWKLDLLQQNK